MCEVFTQDEMKAFKILSAALALAFLPAPSPFAASEPDAGQICISVGRLLEQGHYTRRKLTEDGFSQKFLKNYLDFLDFNHLFFTQQDVDQFQTKYGNVVADDILLGNAVPAFEIFDLYVKRVDDRMTNVKELLKASCDFKSDRTVEINRQKAPWPKDEADADQLWRDRVEGELLQEKLNEKATEPGVKVITRRYDQLLRNVHEQSREDVLKTYLTVLAQSYDPHSEYLSKSDMENFSITMRLSLVGIGAVLQSEEGYAKIMDLVAGGPAQNDGRLKVGDRISAVAQGDKDFVDVIGMKLDKVVEMIRGQKGTKVRLQVVPVHAADPSQRKVVEIIRDEIKLKDAEAKADIIENETPGGGAPQRIGWITLPSFYADMEHMGAKGAKSTTHDVAVLLERLKRENISGLVLDLRRNGGGSLEEAVNLTGLFIKKGPVVQARDANGNVHVSRDKDPSVAYDGPMVVLTNRLSASASEICAAALQDYGRAVVVGDPSSFGKGTVQTMLEIGRFIPFLGSESNEAGALKLTIQKFYRIAGGSTQLRGVVSDITLPSPWDHPEIGESALKGPLPYDEVDPLPYEKWEKPLFIKELKQRSAGRVASDQEFRYVQEDLARAKARLAENKVSLNEEKRRAEIAEDKARKETRTAERAKHKRPEEKVFQITLDNVDKPELQVATNEKKKPAAEDDDSAEDAADKAEDKQPPIDAVRSETVNIVRDFIELAGPPKTASVDK
jgi:carboxyl-terminal processing protease